jgi:hypothetical protein
MRPSPGGAKLLLTYDINSEDADTYFRFFLGRYIPQMQSLGMEISEAWHTGYGSWPNRLIGFVAADADKLLALPRDTTWLELNEELQEYVSGFSYKIVPYREGFQY